MHCWGQDDRDLDSYSNSDDSDDFDGSDSDYFDHHSHYDYFDYYSHSDYSDFDSDGSCRFDHCWGQDDWQPICAGWGDNFSGWSLIIIYV